MSIFGQVWLWSAAAFLIGVLLTWVFLVRPAQARNRVLERRLLAARNEKSAPPAPVATRTFEPEPVEPQERAVPAPVAASRAAAEPAAAEEQRREPRPGWYERDSFAGSGQHVSSVLEPEPAAEQTSVFRPQEPVAHEPSPTSVFAPENGAESYRTSAEEGTFGAAEEQKRQPQRGSLFDPSYEQAEPVSAPDSPPAFAFSDAEPPEQDEVAAETTHTLPRRQPRTPPRGGFEAPQPIQPSMRAMERREPLQADEGGRSGSLFEPVVRPKSGGAHSAPEPPPARAHTADSHVAPGPFGPGSAMPLPGGASPSEEFTVKASVTALRYCTEDSQQFPRMVAEVWFRSAADAERVGFRPLH
ncbi:hypothetical protein HFP15_22920 [Amycolatopsis sp. K13G38]|uniref:Membrane protein ArfC n=1 Tax=Amycolatopsis acididurans TaxID=2724524 RepID=A0ABX1JA10_9PSEU|nr:hypothetical protein [Amycolatopsis acididurans]NKQ55734.1 hypothetical protein [Amycolatopsis acididurans]